MRFSNTLLVATAALVLGASGVAHADVAFSAAAVCMPWSGTASAQQYPTFSGGVQNDYTGGTATLQCGVHQDVASDDTNDVLRVYYTDNNGGDFGYPVDCRVYYTDLTGSYYTGMRRYSCSTPGGCSTNSDGPFTGAGYLTLSGFTHGPGWIANAHCKIPARTGALGASVIESLYLDNQ